MQAKIIILQLLVTVPSMHMDSNPIPDNILEDIVGTTAAIPDSSAQAELTESAEKFATGMETVQVEGGEVAHACGMVGWGCRAEVWIDSDCRSVGLGLDHDLEPHGPDPCHVLFQVHHHCGSLIFLSQKTHCSPLVRWNPVILFSLNLADAPALLSGLCGPPH